MEARSLNSSCVIRVERDVLSWRILRPTSLTMVAWMVRSAAGSRGSAGGVSYQRHPPVLATNFIREDGVRLDP